MLLVRYSQSVPTPWANGGGTTTELISWQRSRQLSRSGVPAWRLSIAHLTGAASFSVLPGVRRLFLPVGTDVALAVAGAMRQVGDGTVTAFDGEDVVALVGLDPRPGHAVNLMYRPGPAGAGLALVLGTTGDDAFGRCLAAVALGTAADVAHFDVLAPGPAGAPGPAIEVVMIVAVDAAVPVDPAGPIGPAGPVVRVG